MPNVRYDFDGTIASITIDDGKANALSPMLQADIGDALDHAEADGAVVLISGREGLWSAGFDLGVMAGDDPAAMVDMVIGGFRLAHRLLSFPRPVVIACTGHAVAMGAFLLLSGDHRVGIDHGARIVANEVAIGMTLPHSALVLMQHRLTPSACTQSALLAQPFGGDAAVQAGYLDEVVAADAVTSRAGEVATMLVGLDADAHRRSKLRLRGGLLDALTSSIKTDHADLTKAAGLHP